MEKKKKNWKFEILDKMSSKWKNVIYRADADVPGY